MRTDYKLLLWGIGCKVACDALDVVSTYFVLQNPNGIEVNPVGIFILEHAGFYGISLAKLISVIALWYVCKWIYDRSPAHALMLMWLAVGITFTAGYGNILQLIYTG